VWRAEPRRLRTLVVVLALGAAACGGDEAEPAAPAAAVTTTSAPAAPPDADQSETASDGDDDLVDDVETPPAPPLELRPLSTSDDLRIVDDLGREVLLRGANLNSLGEYWQGDPDHVPTAPATEADWDDMASRGFSVVRLIVSWSRVEPERGQISEAYLDEIDAYVTAAAEHGIYTVIDMHQDAYSAFIATEDDVECDADPVSRPGKGWDGAPEWATITDGLSSCITGERNSAPAVVAAWNHFYDDTDGIRQRFTASWAVIAERFAGRPEVAGYDLINEPEVSRPAAEIQPLYEQLLVETVDAIRAAEAGAAFDHLIFVEPAIPAADWDLGVVIPEPAAAGGDTDGIVAAPHNYAESIDTLGLTIEETFELYLGIADGLGVPTWIGEYGFWDTSDETLAKVRRYAAAEDAHALGGAWWQWRQECGDPHNVTWGVPFRGEVVHLNVVGCPDDVDLGPNEAFLSVLGRGYPRAAPGRLTELTSDPDTGELTVVAGDAPVGVEVVVWTPTDADTHAVSVTGLTSITEHAVGDGRIVVARTTATDWELRITPNG
jgi:endoglycosylceramidase